MIPSRASRSIFNKVPEVCLAPRSNKGGRRRCWEAKRGLVLQGLALVDIGEAMRELGEVKDALDMEVKQNFIDPLQNLHEKDLKEIQVGRKGHWFEEDVVCCLFP